MPIKIEINQEHQIVVPADIRKALRLRPGDHLLVDIRDGAIVLVPEHKDAVDQLAGLHREIWEGADANTYINQERDAWEIS